MIADAVVLASFTYATRNVEKEAEKFLEHEEQHHLHALPEELQADKAAKEGRSAAVRQRTNDVSNKKKHLNIGNNHRKEMHFNIQQPGRK